MSHRINLDLVIFFFGRYIEKKWLNSSCICLQYIFNMTLLLHQRVMEVFN